MKLETGLHPGRWHVGAWILLALVLALALVLSHRSTGGGTAWAGPAPGEGMEGGGATYVAEVLDSLFFVSPAGFLALDLPRDPAGARAVHLSGTVSVRGRNRDIMVRLFRSQDYDAWLHPRGASKGEPLWTSKRARSHQVDFVLPEGGPFVLLLDNGYSIRTPKHVSCQLQVQYRRTGVGQGERGGQGTGRDTTTGAPQGAYDEANPVTPRGNTDDEIPPPPPPPPAGY